MSLLEEESKILKIANAKRGETQALDLSLVSTYNQDWGNTYYFNAVGDKLIYPAKIEHDLNTGAETVMIRYFKDEEHSIAVEMPIENLASNNLRLLQRAGVPVHKAECKYLAEMLFSFVHVERETYIPVVYRVNHIGWIDKPDIGFVPYNARAVFSLAGQYAREFKAVKTPKGRLRDWVDLFRPYRDDDHVNLRIVMAASFSSVLVRKMECLPYMLDIWGSVSGLGKTVSLMAAASVWAKPGPSDGYMKTFNSTNIALEQGALFCCDLPLCLDEQQTQNGRSDFDDLIYQLCEGVPRGRGRSQGGLRDQYGWKNCIIATGEQPIVTETSRAGSLNRVIAMYCDKPLFTDDTLVMNEFCEKLNSNYGTAGRKFVKLLMVPDNLDYARQLYEDFKEVLVRQATGKQALSAALIMTADALIEQWFFKDGVRLTPEQLTVFLLKDDEIGTNERALESLYEWLYANEEKFKADTNYKCGKIMTSAGKKYWAIRKFDFEQAMDRLGFSDQSFKTWALERGLMIVDNGRKDRSVQINGNNVHCICIAVKDEETT